MNENEERANFYSSLLPHLMRKKKPIDKQLEFMLEKYEEYTNNY